MQGHALSLNTIVKLKVFVETQNSSRRVLWLSWCLHSLILQMHVLKNVTKILPDRHVALVGSKISFHQNSISTRKIHPHLSAHIHTDPQIYSSQAGVHRHTHTFGHTNFHTHMGTCWHTHEIQKGSMEIQG